MSRTAHALVLLALAACARAGAPDLPPGSAPPGGDACALGDGATRADTLTLAPAAPVDPARAPNPASDAERLAFRQLYATLVQLDCTGAPRPGLAQAWRREDERTWSFLLRADATFWDGSPVLAEPVIAAWRSRPTAWEVIDRAGIASIAAAGTREIRVAFATPEDRAPALFAHPALAPVQPPGTGTWAVGAGPWRPAAGGAESPAPGSPFLRFAPAARDPRDALDAGADILLTDDPSTIAYAATRTDLLATPLPWSRTYVIVSNRTPGGAGAALGESLARDVVRADARAARPPFWWETGCAAAATATPAATRQPRVVYPAGDRTARDLAARFVSLGAAGPRGSVLALPVAELLDALAAGRHSAYIVALPRAPIVLCMERPVWPQGWTVTPLVDTRAHLVSRRPVPRLTVDWDGAVRVNGPIAGAEP